MTEHWKISLSGKNTHSDDKWVEMPALGRPFDLGMLYDCRNDKLIPGFTLWDKEKLEADIRVTAKPSCEFKMSLSESITDKCSLLEIDSSLKASFLSGLLLNIDGSAKYLSDSKASKEQARVTMKCKTVTQFKELTMNHLGKDNIKHGDVIKNGFATHIVTAIQYGAQAIFVFNKDVSKHENMSDVQGSLERTVDEITSPVIKGKWKTTNKDTLDRCYCKFYGDCCPDQVPVTLEDARKICQEMPKFQGPNGERAVPMKVWLMPLSFFDPTAAKLVNQISLRLIVETQKIQEDFSDLESRCNNILQCESAQQFSQILQKVKTFISLCSEFNEGFQRKLAKKVPAIRGGKEDESELTEILRQKAASPFSSKSLKKWMDSCEGEVIFLNSLIEILSGIKVVQSDMLESEIYSTPTVVCYVFYLSDSEDEPYLCALEKYLKGTQSKQQWSQGVKRQQLFGTMKKKAELFRDIAKDKDDDSCKFLAVGLSDKNHKDLAAAIHIYKDGLKTTENFEPPSKPEDVTAEKKDSSVILKFCPPKDGARAVTGYKVSYSVTGEDKWHHQTVSQAGEVTVADLNPNKDYTFRVRAITDVGVGPAAEVKTFSNTWMSFIWGLLEKIKDIFRYFLIF